VKSIIKISILALSIVSNSAAQASTVALKNINIVDVENLTVIKNQTVFIQDNKISKIEENKRLRYKKGLVVIDMSDKYLIPGLIDTHVHHATDPDGFDNDQITRMRLRHLLRGGVTSVRDMGGDTRALASLKRRAEIDMIQSPDIYYSVIIGGKEFFSDPRTVSSAKGRQPGSVDWMKAVDKDSNFDEIMLRAKGTGATGIKIYAKVSSDVIKLLATAAKKQGLKVWSHVFVGPARPSEAVSGGVEVMSHASDISAEVVKDFYQMRRKKKMISKQQQEDSFKLDNYRQLMSEMKKRGTTLDPTLTVFERSGKRNEISELLYQWGNTFTRMAHESGVAISTGTDSASDYLGKEYPLVHHEMQLLVDVIGMTPLQALQAGTLNGAKVVGMEKYYGVVAKDKVANLVILHSNPEDDIRNTLDIAHVIKNGQFIHRGDSKNLPFSSAKELNGTLWLSGQIGNHPSTMTLVSDDVEQQMTQAMKNMGAVLQEYDLSYRDIVKCTLMLDDIKDWRKASDAYKKFFNKPPARSAFATNGLALGAKVEVECVAKL